MSYTVGFKAKLEGINRYIYIGNCYENITWNVGKMIRTATGLPWKNCANNGLCMDVMPHIQHGYDELCCHPEKYGQYDAPNGWGTVQGTRDFFKRVLDAWHDLVSHDEELAKVATFWIE